MDKKETSLVDDCPLDDSHRSNIETINEEPDAVHQAITHVEHTEEGDGEESKVETESVSAAIRDANVEADNEKAIHPTVEKSKGVELHDSGIDGATKSVTEKSPDLEVVPEDVDWFFYRNWYDDLAEMSEHEVKLHWINYGSDENRFKNFDEVIEEYDLDLSELPSKFDWAVYKSEETERGAESGERSPYVLKVQYLYLTNQIDKRKFDIDLLFYSDVYDDLRGLDVKELLRHWLRYGYEEGRFGRREEFCHRLNISAAAFPDNFDIEQFKELNPEFSHFSTIDALNAILDVAHESVFRLYNDEKLCSEFYFALAQAHEVAGHRHKAKFCYFASNYLLRNAASLEHLANIAFNNGEYLKSALLYKEAVGFGRKGKWLYKNLADSLIKTGELTEAMSICNKGIAEYPDFSGFGGLLDSLSEAFWNKSHALSEAYAFGAAREQMYRESMKCFTQIFDNYKSYYERFGAVPTSAKVNKSRVLIIGDFHISQCVRYRIEQKTEQLELAGYKVTAVSWTDANRAFTELTFNDIVIFYRTPALNHIIKLIAQARALGMLTFYENDDLIFDHSFPPPLEAYSGGIDINQYCNLIRDVALFAAPATFCDYGIASTEPLREKLAGLVKTGKCYLHRNALDSHNFYRLHNHENDKVINIFYGSGTKAHNLDFVEEVLPALTHVLEKYDNVRFVKVGHLILPREFLDKFGERVVEIEMQGNLLSYYQLLSSASINLAVLKNDMINGCKSELKWFEAACFGIPSVVSRTANYEDVIEDGIDGYLADSSEQWIDYVSRLVEDATLRSQMGRSAHIRIQTEYSLDVMAHGIDGLIKNALNSRYQENGNG